jgi:hypothetical protein
MYAVRAQDSLFPVDEWVEVIEKEYFRDLIPSGGAAVKFVSGTDNVLSRAKDDLLRRARQSGLLTATLDPATLNTEGKKPDLHRMDRFFFAVTENVDWCRLAGLVVRGQLQERGYRLPPNGDIGLQAILANNPEVDIATVRRDLRGIGTSLVRDQGMAYEFRSALASLQQYLVEPQPSQPTLQEAVLLWLRGKTKPGVASVLKKIQIYDRITEKNARLMLMSFCRWLPETGDSGLLVLLDLRPYEAKKKTRSQSDRELIEKLTEKLREAFDTDATIEEVSRIVFQEESSRNRVFYSDLAYLRMLSLLRHFIDDIDRFERFMLVVLTSPEFYDSDSPRSYVNYDALQTRIGIEVRDTTRPNPFASLVHLGEGKGDG